MIQGSVHQDKALKCGVGEWILLVLPLSFVIAKIVRKQLF